jgi:outer membrane receptor for ferric coprogen and ferric-rhodotorulic acid
MLSGIKSNGLQGSYGVDAGLEKLLLNAPLNFRASGSNAFIIEKRNINTLATAQVSDNTLGNNTEGTGSYTTGSMSSATGLNLSMRDTPQSVSVVTSQLMQDQNLRTLTDVANNTAGISTRINHSTDSRYATRGFKINNYQIDGVVMPLRLSGQSQTNTAMYERVEIVRGATGLLTGAGNPSAAINLIRKHANSTEFSANAKVGIGSWQNYYTTADISTPLNSDGSVRGRIVLNYEEGEYFQDFADNTKQLFYVVVDTDLGESTQLSLGSSYQDNDSQGATYGGLPSFHSDGSRTNWERSKSNGSNSTYWNTNNKTYFANLSHELSNGWQARINLNHAENSGDKNRLYLYGITDKDSGLGLTAYPDKSNDISKQNDISLQLNGLFNWLEREHVFTFGAMHSTDDYTTYDYDIVSNEPVGNFNLWDGYYQDPQLGKKNLWDHIVTKQSGIYAASRLSLTDSFKVIVGGRISDWKRDSETAYSGDFKVDSDRVFLRYAGALYDFNSNHTVYVSYTEIFNPQENKDRQGNYLDPEEGINYEIGFKSSFYDGLLNTSVSVFKIEQDNLAQPDKGHFIPGTTDEASIALQGTESKGFEFEVVGELLPDWNVSLSYSQFSADDAHGKAVNTYMSRKLLKMYSSYNFTGRLNNLTIGGGINWQDGHHEEFTNPITGQPDKLEQQTYALVSLMAHYQINKQLSTQLNVENLLDKTYYSSLGLRSQAYGKPRSINLNLSYQF